MHEAIIQVTSSLGLGFKPENSKEHFSFHFPDGPQSRKHPSLEVSSPFSLKKFLESVYDNTLSMSTARSKMAITTLWLIVRIFLVYGVCCGMLFISHGFTASRTKSNNTM